MLTKLARDSRTSCTPPSQPNVIGYGSKKIQTNKAKTNLMFLTLWIKMTFHRQLDTVILAITIFDIQSMNYWILNTPVGRIV